jgi:hypothetical protein
MEIRIVVGLSATGGGEDEGHAPVLVAQLLRAIERQDPVLMVNAPPAIYVVRSVTVDSTPGAAG